MGASTANDQERRRLRWLAAALSAGLLAWSVGANLGLGEWLYVRRNLALTVLLLLLARWAGLSSADLGLARAKVGAGVRWGASAALVVAVVLAAALALQDVAGPVALLLGDRRAVMPEGGLLYQATLRIPIGTAVFEEVAFRGVLLALLARTLSLTAAVTASSVVFGFWHVAPTMVALRVNGVAIASIEGLGAIAGAVVVTVVAGLLFCWLRIRADSLLAPTLAHWATNSLGLLAAASTQAS